MKTATFNGLDVADAWNKVNTLDAETVVDDVRLHLYADHKILANRVTHKKLKITPVQMAIYHASYTAMIYDRWAYYRYVTYSQYLPLFKEFSNNE